MRFRLIGHSTVLIETDDARFLTDPFFGLRGTFGLKLASPPSMSAEEAALLVDVVLISHGHYDHIDPPFFALLRPTVDVVVPSGFRKRGFLPDRVVRLSEWQTCSFGDARVTAVPATHTGVACGYVIQSDGKTLYFAGDTRYDSFMAELGRRFDLDAALLPLRQMRFAGGIEPRCAVPAARDLNAPLLAFVHRDALSVLDVLNLPATLGECQESIRAVLPGVRLLAPANGEIVEV